MVALSPDTPSVPLEGEGGGGEGGYLPVEATREKLSTKEQH